VARIPTVVPDVAAMPDAQAYVGRPVLWATPSNMADTTNALLLGRHLRLIPVTFTATDTIPEAVQSYTYRIRWVSSPGAQYVWVGFWPLAVNPVAGSVPVQEVAATLQFVTGAPIDGPVYWRNVPAPPGLAGHGRLPLSPAVGGGAFRAALTPFAQTGWALPIDPLYAGPRLLDLGLNQAADVEVTLATLNVRLYSGIVIEVFRPEVT